MITRIFSLITFTLYVLWEILVSNIRMAWMMIQPPGRLKAMLDPGIIAIPLSVTTDLEIITLATVITLTPGTLSVDLGQNEKGQQVLYVHNLQVIDPEQFRASLKDGFERRILQISQGNTGGRAKS